MKTVWRGMSYDFAASTPAKSKELIVKVAEIKAQSLVDYMKHKNYNYCSSLFNKITVIMCRVAILCLYFYNIKTLLSLLL